MIEELLAQGQYQEALEYLDDQQDEQVRYYRLICLYGLGEFKQGLEEAKVAKMLAKDTYYDVLCYYISFLKENEMYQEAVDTLVEELSMPYIPYQYESKLNEAYDEILLLKSEANALYEGRKRIFSNEEIELYFQNGFNEETNLMLLEQLAGQNIRRYLGNARPFLKDPQRSSFEKTVFLEILKDQEVDEELVVCKHQHTAEINPIYLEHVLESDAYEQIGGLLERVIEQDNPSLFSMCLDYLEYYLCDWYPMLEVIEDYETTAAAIHYYIGSLMDLEDELDEICYLYGADNEAILELVESFEKSGQI